MPRQTLSPNRKTRKTQVRKTVATLAAAAVIAQFLATAWSSPITAPDPGGANSCNAPAWQTTLNAALQCLPLLSQSRHRASLSMRGVRSQLISLFSERCGERS